MKRAAIVGASAIPVARSLSKSVRDTASEVCLAAIADAGLEPKEIDGLFVSPPGLSRPGGFMWSCTLSHHLGLRTRAQAMVECGGMTAALAFKLAAQEVALGRCRFALALGVDVRADEDAEDFEHFLKGMTTALLGLYGPYDGVFGLAAPIPYYAMSAQRYLHEHRLSREDLAEVCVALRRFAAENPRAQHRKPISVKDVLEAPPVSPPLGLLDCSSFASGAAAVVVAEESWAKEAKRPSARVRAVGEAHEPAHFAPLKGPISRFESASRAAAEAYAEAGIRPRDVDVAEVYGVFSATELILYEDLGFFERGASAAAVRDGRTSGSGGTVFNPSGGRLSLGHPAGATPLYSMVELLEQLRGGCGKRQVKDAAVGLLHAEHGMLNGSLVAILEAAP
ncbi:MAG: thiolase family protein [Myxococcales bacterium]|nr:thiolase family protein [Myxococcales bacterium]